MFGKNTEGSFREVVGKGTVTEDDRLTRLVEGAIFKESPRGGLQNDTLAVSQTMK